MTMVGSAIRSAHANWTALRHSREVRVAIAGLSRSGKTAFITSVIANLIASCQNRNAARWLQGLKVLDDGRMCGAELPRDHRPSTSGRVFPYNDMLSALASDAPTWPKRTADTYEAAVDVLFWPKKVPDFSKVTNPPAARLRLVFVDYPGEWLVDVALLGQSYEQWSQTVLDRLNKPAWSGISNAFRDWLETQDWQGPDDNDAAKQAALHWQRVLVAACTRGLKWLQPGKFLRQPGQADDGGAGA